MRRYAALSVNEVIVIEYGADRFYVRVLELKPAPVVSLCGDVDLEMDFAAPEVRLSSTNARLLQHSSEGQRAVQGRRIAPCYLPPSCADD